MPPPRGRSVVWATVTAMSVAADVCLELPRAYRVATTWPWSSTTTSSASRSASSRYCVVSTSVVPSRDELAQEAPEIDAGLRVETGGGLVEEQHLRARRSGGGQVEPAAHAARESVLDDARAGDLRQGEALNQLVGAFADGPRCEADDRAARPSRGSQVRSIRPSTVAYWPARPRRRSAPARGSAHDVEARPPRRCPVVGRDRVVRMRMVVVLPAPLWPRRPRTVPAGTSRSRSRRAERSPKRLLRPYRHGLPALPFFVLEYRCFDIVRATLAVRHTKCQVHCTTWRLSAQDAAALRGPTEPRGPTAGSTRGGPRSSTRRTATGPARSTRSIATVARKLDAGFAPAQRGRTRGRPGAPG